jgi:hypothetical protein
MAECHADICGLKTALHSDNRCGAVFMECVLKERQTNLILRAAKATILSSNKPCFQREMLVVP